jgi:hypothetical protein
VATIVVEPPVPTQPTPLVNPFAVGQLQIVPTSPPPPANPFAANPFAAGQIQKARLH